MLTIDETLGRLAIWAESKPQVRCAVLFGSYAKGKTNPRDLDVALVADR
jgi:predicted nucleotidyltransferase